MSGARAILIGGALAMLMAVPVAAKSPAARRAVKPAIPTDTSAVLVKIGKAAITRATVQARLDDIPESVRAQYLTPEGRQQVLDRMVDERIWLLVAMRAGVPDRPQVKRQLEQQRQDLLIRTYLSEAMAASPAPTDSEARAYYDQHQQDYRVASTVTARQILTKTEAEAKRVLPFARAKGADFAALAKKYSTDSLTRGNGGLLGTLTRDGLSGALGMQPALAESAFALREGGIGGPYHGARGWHLIKIDARTAEGTRTFDQVHSPIMRKLTNDRTQEFYRGLLDQARHDLGVTADSTAIKHFLSAKKSARDLFKEAQEAGPPTDRIALYQKVLEQYPDADVAPQAQFMIGFIYSEELKNYERAEREFRQLLARYPKSELAASAKYMIEHPGADEAPPMLQLDADGAHAASPADTTRGSRVPGKETAKTP